jgi:hypothetical protein
MNPNYTPEQVRDFLVRVYNFDPATALTAANTALGIAPVAPPATPPTTTQTFDDGSQLVTNTQTGQVVSSTPGTDVVLPTATVPAGVTEVRTERQWAPRGDGQGITTTYSDGSSRFVGDDGSVFTKQPDRGWTQITSATTTPAPTPTPTPTPAPEIDVSTNVQVFDDGSILVTNGSGQVIGTVDSTGSSPNLTVTNYDDGSVLITDTQGEPLGGVDSSGNTFNINNQGNAVYQDTQQPIAPLPITPPPPPATDEGYGEGFPEEVDISGSNPPPEPPVVPEDTETVIDDIVHSDTEKPILPEEPVVPEIPYIPPYIPPEPEAPSKPPQGTYVPAAPDPRYLGRLPLPGLNPGYMEQGVEPMYQTTSPVQSQYYCGNQRGFQNLQDLQDNYNRINNVPEQPWGAQRGWWEQPMVNPATYQYDMSFQPTVPQGQLPGYYGTPNVDYSRIAQNYVPVAPQLSPISEYKLAQGQYYDASGNPVAG